MQSESGRRAGRKRRRRRYAYAIAIALAAVAAPALVTIARCALATPTPAPAVLRDPPEVARAKSAVTGYGRSGAATFFTFPEWLIVYDAEEYAAQLKSGRPSGFAYFRSIPRYWQAYQGVCAVACRRFPFDGGDHLMLAIVGTSTSIENALKGVYENTAGRATEWIGTTDTDEDRLAAAVAADYARFIHTVPWYDFPFGHAFARVWSETTWWGPHPLRKWERKLALGLEYGIKAIYGAVIRFGTKQVYGDEDEWTYAWIEALPAHAFNDTRLKRVAGFSDGSSLVAIKRYEPFTEVLTSLVARGARLRDVAGNRRILFTAFGGNTTPAFDDRDAHVLFSQRALTSDRRRFAIEAGVDALGRVLERARNQGLDVEHIYDY